MLGDLTYAEAIKKAEHLIALGETTVYLRGEDLPWALACDVEDGHSCRLNGPSSVYIIAKASGLTFRWSVDFETHGANGTGTADFDRAKLRDVAGMLPTPVRRKLGRFFETGVLGPLQKRTAELRKALNRQADSEDCVRGLIAFCAEEA